MQGGIAWHRLALLTQRSAVVVLGLALAAAFPPAARSADEPVERLEAESRAKPDVVADELERLLSAGPIEGNARLDVDSLLGYLRARLRQPAAAEAVAQGLQKPGAPGYQKIPAEQLNA